MSSPDVRAWLSQHEPPAMLLDRMLHALGDGGHAAASLGDAALACMGDALLSIRHRPAALSLLAADALLTYGCEMAAAESAEALEAYCRRFDARRMAALLSPGA